MSIPTHNLFSFFFKKEAMYYTVFNRLCSVCKLLILLKIKHVYLFIAENQLRILNLQIFTYSITFPNSLTAFLEKKTEAACCTVFQTGARAHVNHFSSQKY